MTGRPPSRYPWWVRLMTLGAASRRALQFWAALYTLTAIGSVLYAIAFEDDLTYGMVFAIVFITLAGAHWLAIRWIDRHGSWQ